MVIVDDDDDDDDVRHDGIPLNPSVPSASYSSRGHWVSSSLRMELMTLSRIPMD